VVIGTPAYMAPEQFRDARDVDARADVFALGGMLYELASGRRALRGDDMISVHVSATRGDFAPLSEVAPDVPARWSEAVRRALQPRREDRPATVRELLELWCGDEPAPDVRWDADVVRGARAAGSLQVTGSLSSLTDGREGPRRRWIRAAGWLVAAGASLLGLGLLGWAVAAALR
jgi:serine/threonine protein kinase